jgi:hypothetical protein
MNEENEDLRGGRNEKTVCWDIEDACKYGGNGLVNPMSRPGADGG